MFGTGEVGKWNLVYTYCCYIH